jgi:hypothetical protein
VLAGVTDDLGRGVEAHRLAIEQRAGEGRRKAAFEPGRDIDQVREARRVGLWETVLAEAFDLAEAPLGEVAGIAAGRHSLDQLFTELMDHADPAEGGHGAPKPVGLGRREAGGDDGDPHRLLLEEWHPEGLPQHLAELFRRVLDRLLAVAATQIGMDHVALNRTGTDDGHLDHQVVEALRFHARQEVHLRPALDLEDADGIGPAQHVVNAPVFRRHRRQREVAAVGAADQVEGLVDTRQHAEPQHVDLEDPQGVEVVLVPLDDGAALHRRVLDRHHLAERAAGDDEAAHMLGEMAGKADELPREPEHQAQRPLVWIEPQLTHPRLIHALAAAAPDLAGERPHGIKREPQGLAHVADRTAGAVVDDGRRQPRPIAAVLVVDVLDHLLAPLVLEVDVDVGRLVALGGDEALEEKVDAVRVDRGDAEAVADSRVGGRAAALAQDPARAGEADEIVHGEEIGRVIERGDQPELVLDQPAHLIRDAAWVALSGAGPGQLLQLFLGRAAAAGELVRVLVAELVEAEGAGLGDLDRAGKRPRVIAEEPRHLGRRLEMPFGIGGEAEARLADRALLADAGQHIGQGPARGVVHGHVVGGHQGHAAALRECRESRKPAGVVPAIEVVGGEITGPRKVVGQLPQPAREGRIGLVRGKGDDDLAGPVFEQVLKSEITLSLRRAAAAQRDEPREPPVGRAVGGKGEQARSVLKLQPGADYEAEPGLFRRHMGAHDAGE